MYTNLLETIKTRRSVREFTAEPVSQLDVMQILEAGSWAPSIHNCQPWKFVVVQDAGVRATLSACTKYSTSVSQCQVIACLFIGLSGNCASEVAHQSAGAAIQNMLLTADDLGLGAVWLGDIQDCREQIRQELGIDAQYQLAAMVAIGYPAHRNQKSHRKHVQDFILKTIGG